MHLKRYTEKKTKRFIGIQQMFCRNKIRPWCLVQWQLLKKWCQWNNRTYGHLRTQVILHAVYAIFHKFCGHSDRVFRVYYSLEIVFPHFNDFWSTIYLTTYVGSDGDLFLFLTFCQKSDWFYQPTVQLLGRWPYIFKHFLRHCLGFLRFTYSEKVALAIWCFDLANEFQPVMLNYLLCFHRFLMAEEVAASRELGSSAYKFSISSKCFSSVHLKFWQCTASMDNCNWSSTVGFHFRGSNSLFPRQ